MGAGACSDESAGTFSSSPCDSCGVAGARGRWRRGAVVDRGQREARLDLVGADALLLLFELVARQHFEQRILLLRHAGQTLSARRRGARAARRRARRIRRCC